MSTDDRPTPVAAAAPDRGAAALDDALARLATAADRLAAVEVAGLSGERVADAVARLAAVGGRLEGISARFVAAAEAAGVPGAAGAPSTTSWLARVTGRNRGQAARGAKLARAVVDAPELGDALSQGDVGPDQAASIASALDRGVLTPNDTGQLLADASVLDPTQFARQTRQREARRDQRQLRRDEQLAHRRRSLDTWRTDDGSLHGKFRLAPAAGDTVQSALQALIAPDPAEVPDDLRRTPRQLRADALVDLADQVLRGGVAGDVGGVRPHVTMTVPVGVMADTLEDAAAAGVVGTTDLGTTLSAAAARKLLCDATVRRLVVDPAGVPLDVGRATRQWSSSQRAAITVVDGGCRAPGCGLPPARCVVHHITWWRDGGTTDVANGVLVCNHGHDLIHDHGWTLTMDPATRVCAWTAPDGTHHLTRPRGPAATNPGIPATPAAGSGPAPDAPTSTNRTPRPAGTRTIGPAPDRPPPSRRATRSHRSGREPPEDDTDAATEPRLEL